MGVSEEEMAKILAAEIQEMVDLEILLKLYKEGMGWGEEVYLKIGSITGWDYAGLLKGGCWHNKAMDIWIFELDEDKTFFTLKWAEHIQDKSGLPW